jgi:Spy/CpxP family protein refolding chaperone
MKTTRSNINILVVILLLLTSAMPVFAKHLIQSKQSNLDKRMQKMTQNLSLTSEQVTKIRPLLETQDKEIQNIRVANKSNHNVQKKEVKARQAAEREINRQADKDNHATMHKAIAASDSTLEKGMAVVLTPEQNKKFLDDRKKK